MTSARPLPGAPRHPEPGVKEAAAPTPASLPEQRRVAPICLRHHPRGPGPRHARAWGCPPASSTLQEGTRGWTPPLSAQRGQRPSSRATILPQPTGRPGNPPRWLCRERTTVLPRRPGERGAQGRGPPPAPLPPVPRSLTPARCVPVAAAAGLPASHYRDTPPSLLLAPTHPPPFPLVLPFSVTPPCHAHRLRPTRAGPSGADSRGRGSRQGAGRRAAAANGERAHRAAEGATWGRRGALRRGGDTGPPAPPLPPDSRARRLSWQRVIDHFRCRDPKLPAVTELRAGGRPPRRQSGGNGREMPSKSSFSGYLTKKQNKEQNPPGKGARVGLSPACVSLHPSHPSEDRGNRGIEGGKGGGAASHREKATGSRPRSTSDTGNDPATPPGLQPWPPAARTFKKARLGSQLRPQPLRSHTLEETAGFHPKTVTAAAGVPATRSVAVRDVAASRAVRPDTDFLGDYKKNKQIWVRD